MPPLVHPQDVPATIGKKEFPEDFSRYQYHHPAIVRMMNKANKHNRAFVACLVLHDQLADGASADIEMTVSLRDLVNGHHPQAEAIALELTNYYMTKIPASKKIDRGEPHQKRSASPVSSFVEI